jgi:hypothetical protein
MLPLSVPTSVSLFHSPVSPTLTLRRDLHHEVFEASFLYCEERFRRTPRCLPQSPRVRKLYDLPVHRRPGWLSARPDAATVLRDALVAVAASRPALRTAFAGMWCMHASAPDATAGREPGSGGRLTSGREARRACRLSRTRPASLWVTSHPLQPLPLRATLRRS